MNWFENIIVKYKKKWNKNTIIATKNEAHRLYQIKEYDSHLWLTYNGVLIVPFHLICDASSTVQCLALLDTIRDLYVKRMIGKINKDER